MWEKAVEGHSCSLCQHYQQGECVEVTTGQEMESRRKRSLNCLTICNVASSNTVPPKRHDIQYTYMITSDHHTELSLKIYLLQVLTCRLTHAKPHFLGLFFHSEFSKSVHVLYSAGVNVLVGSELSRVHCICMAIMQNNPLPSLYTQYYRTV